MPPSEEHKQLLQLLKENTALVKENNELLKKLYRHSIWELVLRVAWYSFIIGAPFAFYFYFFRPYFDVLGINYETFKQGINQIQGLGAFQHTLHQVGK